MGLISSGGGDVTKSQTACYEEEYQGWDMQVVKKGFPEEVMFELESEAQCRHQLGEGDTEEHFR